MINDKHTAAWCRIALLNAANNCQCGSNFVCACVCVCQWARYKLSTIGDMLLVRCFSVLYTFTSFDLRYLLITIIRSMCEIALAKNRMRTHSKWHFLSFSISIVHPSRTVRDAPHTHTQIYRKLSISSNYSEINDDGCSSDWNITPKSHRNKSLSVARLIWQCHHLANSHL